MKRRYLIETQNIYGFVAWHFLGVFLLLMLTQLLFALVNHNLFLPSSFGEKMMMLWGNIRFGLSATAMVLAPFAFVMHLPLKWRYAQWYQAVARWLSAIGMGFLLAANIADIPYFQWTLRRTAGDIFSYLSNNFEGGALVGQMLKDFWPYFLLWLVLFDLWVFFVRNLRIVRSEKVHRKGYFWREWAKGILFLALVLTCIRGGWILQHKPLAPVDASRYAKAGNQALVINTPFSIIRTLGNTSSVNKVGYFSDEAELERCFSPVIPPMPIGSENRVNVVLLLLESFSEEYMGCINQGGESYTPFLDSLAQHCAVYRGRANGKRSIESLPALFLGIPALMDKPYITSTFSQNRVTSLPQILKQHGYQTAFFHGAYNGSMNFDGFTKMIGFDHYYGMDEYDNPNDFDGTWGIFDEPFLQFGVQQMSAMKAPFFVTLYTISSHHPYPIPEGYKGRFKKGEIPLLETIGYADNALRRFFESASKAPWFMNTVFIITADHSAQPLSDYYRDHAYNVPFFIYYPREDYHGVSDQLFQHIDFAPTLLSFLGMQDTCFSFGHNVLSSPSGYHVVRPGNYYQMEREGKTLVFDGASFSPADAKEEDKRFLQAVIQQYNNRMVENRLSW